MGSNREKSDNAIAILEKYWSIIFSSTVCLNFCVWLWSWIMLPIASKDGRNFSKIIVFISISFLFLFYPFLFCSFFAPFFLSFFSLFFSFSLLSFFFFLSLSLSLTLYLFFSSLFLPRSLYIFHYLTHMSFSFFLTFLFLFL